MPPYTWTVNKLEKLEAFEKVLADYQLSDEAKQALRKIHLVILVGPSSSGRNTIINELVKKGGYHFVVSDTTRQPRVNNGILEQDGREYWFRSEDEILEDLKAGKFLEAAIIHHQQVSGISIRELQAAADAHEIAINEIEIVGAGHVHDISPGTMFLFIVPPSFDEWIARMNARSKLPADETRRRLESAISEITIALAESYYTFVVNDTFTHTARRVDEIIKGKAASAEDQAAAKSVARQLLADTQAFLLTLS